MPDRPSAMLDTAPLIPTNGVHVTPTYYPSGWFVARYDAEGLVSEQRWFSHPDNARAYAERLRRRPA